MVILPPTDTSNILQLLADPKAVKANIEQLQAMSEQYQRDAKSARDEQDRLVILQKDLEDKSVSLSIKAEDLDNRQNDLKSFKLSLDSIADKQDQRLSELLKIEQDVKDRQDLVYLMNKEVETQTIALKAGQDKLNADKTAFEQAKKDHEEWRASISSILSSKP